MGYDRGAAVVYATTYWTSPCSDSFIMLDDTRAPGGLTQVKAPAGARFVRDAGGSSEHVELDDGSTMALPDGTPVTWDLLDDCTHFISCCVGKPPGVIPAGGLTLPRMWGDPPDDPYGVSRPSTLIDHLVKHGLAKMLAEKTTDDAHADDLKPGDLIAYFDHERGRYGHMALFLGGGRTDGTIATHTISRFNDGWALGRDSGQWLWTFLQMVD